MGKLITFALMAFVGAFIGEKSSRIGLPVNQVSGASGGLLVALAYYSWKGTKPADGALAGCAYMLLTAAVVAGAVYLAWWALSA